MRVEMVRAIGSHRITMNLPDGTSVGLESMEDAGDFNEPAIVTLSAGN